MAEGLRRRVVSAVVLAPPVLAALIAGPPYSDILIVIAAAVLAWEWSGLVLPARGASGWLLVAVLPLLVAGGAFVTLESLAAGLLAGIVLCGVVGLVERRRHAAALWLAGGVLYLAPSCLALLLLRREEPEGLLFVIFVVLTVWAADIGAYFIGKAVGGKKLLPSVSPNKTWAGLFGGMAAAAATGTAVSLLFSQADLTGAATLGAGIAVIDQIGDLFESGIKRRFGRKDSSGLIPGHGGLLDRVDGLMPAAVVVLLLVAFDSSPL
jgi:phosphatidate cytidylyltransferase